MDSIYTSTFFLHTGIAPTSLRRNARARRLYVGEDFYDGVAKNKPYEQSPPFRQGGQYERV